MGIKRAVCSVLESVYFAAAALLSALVSGLLVAILSPYLLYQMARDNWHASNADVPVIRAIRRWRDS